MGVGWVGLQNRCHTLRCACYAPTSADCYLRSSGLPVARPGLAAAGNLVSGLPKPRGLIVP